MTVRLRVPFGFTSWADIHEYFDSGFHAGHHHEYTIEEFKYVFERTGFDIDEFVLYEDGLRSVQVGSMADVKSQGRTKSRAVSEPFFVSAGKRALLVVTALFPRLRGNMLLVVEKR
ncbi:MAG: hypothetical protein ABSD21_08070 [Rhizomicrobium sp.]